jgi:hypothetical protein
LDIKSPKKAWKWMIARWRQFWIWKPPRSIPALKSFLGLAFYYHKLIKNFTKITSPLTNLLKKPSRTYEWDKSCNEAFGTLKGITSCADFQLKWSLKQSFSLQKIYNDMWHANCM